MTTLAQLTGTADSRSIYRQPCRPLTIAALTGMQRRSSGLTWIRQAHVQAVRRDLASQPILTHEILDGLPPGRTTNYVRKPPRGPARRTYVT